MLQDQDIRPNPPHARSYARRARALDRADALDLIGDHHPLGPVGYDRHTQDQLPAADALAQRAKIDNPAVALGAFGEANSIMPQRPKDALDLIRAALDDDPDSARRGRRPVRSDSPAGG